METTQQPAAETKELRESTAHGTPEFPMQAYVNHFRWCPEHLIGWHWHPEVELSVVLSGEVEIFINNTVYKLTAGEGFFINTNAMHMQAAVPVGDEYPVLATICFLPDFIGDCGGDLIFRRYILPITSDKTLRCMKLSPGNEWQSGIIGAVKRVCELSAEQHFGYELRCRDLIGEMWCSLAENIGEAPSAPVDRRTITNEKRLKKMLSYIYENYQNETAVEDIARAANISKSECFRCFRTMIGKKPVAFLNEYRLKKALELLSATDMQITEVCLACGFGHISYFGKLFREAYGMSPREYRNQGFGKAPETS
ncbi:MAG: AraC family transcriptional regulator [Oscillospiraceae bacterium]|nr:AraC family transcriptional regulator [Oscillospiraceae bacterium]